jgi:hypothetical protein
LNARDPNGFALSPLFGNAARDWQIDSNGYDQAQLRAHVNQCVLALGRFNRLRCIAEALNAFLAPRFISVLAVLTAFGVGSSLLI